ncbi:MAG: hypothetical protein ABH864_05235 [archaeon]
MEDDIIEKLRDRGLTCSKLKAKIQQALKQAREFRGYGFMNIAQAEEVTAQKLRGLKTHVCKLQ